MTQIQNLGFEPNQTSTVLLSDNTAVTINLSYNPRTQRWIANITYGDIVINGLNLCVHPNLLRSWRNQIPFGLMCVSPDGVDPFDINDFYNNRVILYVLDNTGTNTDVTYVEQNIIK